MPQSLSVVYLHLIFSTKGRVPYLRDLSLRAEMHAWLGGASREMNCPPLIVGGVEDHVHLLARHSRTLSQAGWVKELKRTSTQWIKKREPKSGSRFAWQSGYGVFSVSVSSLQSAQTYIAQQVEHHREWSFQEEYRALLRKHGETWDERYVWD